MVTEKLVANPKNRPDFTKESGAPVVDAKVENKVNADKGTPDDIVPAENRIVANPKNRPDFTKEVDAR